MTDEFKIPQSVHDVPHGQVDRVGARGAARLVERVAVARRVTR